MILYLLNEDVNDLWFEVKWGNNMKTPAYKLEAGAFGAFDLDTVYKLTNGAECQLCAWQKNSSYPGQFKKSFIYTSGSGIVSTYKFDRKLFNYNGTFTGWQAA